MTEKPSNPKDSVGILKPPLSCVPTGAIFRIGAAMNEGARKYGRHNYRAVGVRASVYYDALMRHMMAWWDGEDIDDESGLCHVDKAAACLVVLMDAQINGKLTDDRPPASAPYLPQLTQVIEAQALRYPNPKEAHTHGSQEEDSQEDNPEGTVGRHDRLRRHPCGSGICSSPASCKLFGTCLNGRPCP